MSVCSGVVSLLLCLSRANCPLLHTSWPISRTTYGEAVFQSVSSGWMDALIHYLVSPCRCPCNGRDTTSLCNKWHHAVRMRTLWYTGYTQTLGLLRVVFLETLWNLTLKHTGKSQVDWKGWNKILSCRNVSLTHKLVIIIFSLCVNIFHIVEIVNLIKDIIQFFSPFLVHNIDINISVYIMTYLLLLLFRITELA